MNDITYIDHPILSIYPNVRGFGYAIFPEQDMLKDYGVAVIRLRDEETYLDRIDQMVKVYRPSLLIIPTPDGKYNRKRERIRSLLEKIRDYAKQHDIVVKSYSREQIRGVFEVFDAYSKVQIAGKLCTWFPELLDRCPERRELYMTENFHQGLFDAISLVVTHNFLTN